MAGDSINPKAVPLRIAFLAIALASAPHSDIPISSCGVLGDYGEAYLLTQPVSNDSTCFTFADEEITLDCQGNSITGTEQGGAIGIYSDMYATHVRNCVISGFDAGIYFDSVMDGGVENTSIDFGESGDWGDYGNGLRLVTSPDNYFSNLNVSGSIGTGIYLDRSNGSQFLHTRAESTYSYAFYSFGSSLFSLYNSTLIAGFEGCALEDECWYPLNLASGSSSNNIVNNTLQGSGWVYDSGSGNKYNDSAKGNAYYFSNGSGAWTYYDIQDLDGDHWADLGASRPFNSTTVSGLWSGNGQDFHPFTLTAGFLFSITSLNISPASPTIYGDISCLLTIANALSNNSTVHYEWYRNGTNQTSYAGTYLEMPSAIQTAISTIPSSELSLSDTWLCSVNVDYNSTNSSGWTNSSPATIGFCGALSAAGQAITLTSGASSSGTCFNVSAANVSIDCAGNPITGANASGSYGIYSNSSNTTVKDCNISNFQHAVYFNGTDNGSISGTNASTTHSGAYGIFLDTIANGNTISSTQASSASGRAIFVNNSNHTSISSSSGVSSASYGIYLQRSNHTSITLSNFSSSSTSGSGAGTFLLARNLTVSHSIFNESAGAPTTTSGLYMLQVNQSNFTNVTAYSGNYVGLYTGSVYNGIFTRINASGPADGVYTSGDNNNTMEGSTVSSNGTSYGAFMFGGSSNWTIRNTTIFSTGSTPALYVTVGTRDNVLDNCTFSSATGNAISIGSGSRVTNLTIKNSVANSAGGSGLAAWTVSKLTLANFTATGAAMGIYLNYTNDSDLANVTAVGGTSYGIALVGFNKSRMENVSGSSNSSYGVFFNISIGLKSRPVFNNITNLTGFSNSSVGVYLRQASNNIINLMSANSSAGSAAVFENSSNNTVGNGTFISNSGAGNHTVVLTTLSSNNTLYNNSLLSMPQTGPLLSVGPNCGANTFYWNNFTATTGLYANDSNGTNKYNATISGKGEGNIWWNVQNRSVLIAGTTASSGFPSLFIGESGAGYPYNNTTAQGALEGNVTDYAPLAPANTAPEISAISLSPLVSTWLSTLSCNITAVDAEHASLTLNISWQRNGLYYSSALYSASNSTPHSQDFALSSAFTSPGDKWSCSAFASDGLLQSATNYSGNSTVYSSPTGSQGSVTPKLAYSFDCLGGKLSITATHQGTPIAKLGIKLRVRNEISYSMATTNSSGVAEFKVLQNGDYVAESAQSSGHNPASIDIWGLKLCGSTGNTLPNATGNASAPGVPESQPQQGASQPAVQPGQASQESPAPPGISSSLVPQPGAQGGQPNGLQIPAQESHPPAGQAAPFIASAAFLFFFALLAAAIAFYLYRRSRKS